MMPAPPEMLSAGPDPLSLLRCFRRRWPLAVGLGLLCAGAVMAVTWYLVPEKGTVVAYVQVQRSPDTLSSTTRHDVQDFNTLRATVMEMMRSKFVLTRALRDQAISQLPVIREHPDDAIEWLQSQLSLRYPGDGELLEVSMEGEDLTQLAKIVNAVIAAYIREVVDVERLEKDHREQRLKQLHEEKSRRYINEIDNLSKVQKAVKVLDPSEAQQRIHLLTINLQTANSLINSLTGQLSNIELDIEKVKLELALATDPAAKEARMLEEFRKDERLRKLEEDLAKFEMGMAEAMHMMKDGRSPAMQRLAKSKAALEDQINERKEELTKRFSDSAAAIEEKEFRGRLAAGLKHKENVEKQLADQLAQAQQIQEELSTITNHSPDLDVSRKKIESLEHETNDMSKKLYDLWLEHEADSRVKKRDDAFPGNTSKKQKIMLVGFNGFAIFFLVGLGISLLEFRARRISSSTQLTSGLGMRVVGALPSISRPGRKALAAANGDLNRLLVESIDTVRTNLIHAAGANPVRVVMVTSALDREGKTTVASQLAASLARCGRRTLLIDGDLRRPTAHRLFELPLEPGLCEVLRGEGDFGDVIRPTRVAGLWMVSAGQYDLESIQALSREGIGEVFSNLRSRFDFVVVDSAPVLSIADASMLGQLVDAAILCVMREVSQAAKVYEASEQLRSVGVPVLGCVINGERTAATYRAYAAKG